MMTGTLVTNFAVWTATLAANGPIMRPLRFDTYWLLLMIPLVIGISVTYKTIKLEDLSILRREATLMTLQIVIFMVVTAAVIFGLTQLL